MGALVASVRVRRVLPLLLLQVVGTLGSVGAGPFARRALNSFNILWFLNHFNLYQAILTT